MGREGLRRHLVRGDQKWLTFSFSGRFSTDWPYGTSRKAKSARKTGKLYLDRVRRETGTGGGGKNIGSCKNLQDVVWGWGTLPPDKIINMKIRWSFLHWSFRFVAQEHRAKRPLCILLVYCWRRNLSHSHHRRCSWERDEKWLEIIFSIWCALNECFTILLLRYSYWVAILIINTKLTLIIVKLFSHIPSTQTALSFSIFEVF